MQGPNDRAGQGPKYGGLPVSPVSGNSICAQPLTLAQPTIVLLDCGCWTSQLRSFGIIFKKYIVLGTYKSDPTDNEPKIKNLPKKLADFIRSVGKLYYQTERSRIDSIAIYLHIQVESVDAHHQAEAETLDDILTSEPKWYLFIPDAHLGILDVSDNFANNLSIPPGTAEHNIFVADRKQSEAYYQRAAPDTNLRLLRTLLNTAHDYGGTVIQTGDFFDFWESEAADKYYYVAPQPSVELSPDLKRCEQGAAGMLTAWTEKFGEDFLSLLSMIDTYLPGNHDIEAKYLHGNLISDKCHSEEYLEQRNSWRAEHFHRYDPFNDTSNTSSVHDVIKHVPGKAMTFDWARTERNYRLRRYKIQPSYDPNMIYGFGSSALMYDYEDFREARAESDDYTGLRSALTNIKYRTAINALLRTLFGIEGALELVEKALPEIFLGGTSKAELATMVLMPVSAGAMALLPWVKLKKDQLVALIRSKANPSRLELLRRFNIDPEWRDQATTASSISWLIIWIIDAIADDLGIGKNIRGGALRHDDLSVNITFVAARLNAMRHIAEQVADLNEAYQFYYPMPASNNKGTGRNLFVLPYKGLVCPTPRFTFPLRVLIHGHTHQPVVVKMVLKHFSSVTGEDSYDENQLEKIFPQKERPRLRPSGLPISYALPPVRLIKFPTIT